MASPANFNISGFFQSPQSFAPLQRRVLFIYNRWTMQKKPMEELVLLKELVEMPLDGELFQKKREDLYSIHGKAKIFEVARTVLSQKGIPSLRSPSNRPPPPPGPPPRTVQVVAAPRPPDVLENEQAFLRLHEQIKKAVAFKEKFEPWELSILGQFRAVEMMLEGNVVFEEAISRCLSPNALQKAVKDIEIPQNETRQALLQKLLKRLETENFSEDDWKQALPKNPQVHARSHTAYVGSQSGALPKQLTSPEQFRKVVEGIVLLKFLFQEFYQKTFCSVFLKKVGEALLDVYLLEKLCGMHHKAALEKICLSFVEEDSEGFVHLCEKLTAQQTLSNPSGPSMKPAKGTFPECLKKRPFNDVQTTRKFMEALGVLKYQLVASYHHLYSEDEQYLIDLFLDAVLLMDFLHHPFEQSMRYAISDFDLIVPEDVASLVAKVFPEEPDPIVKFLTGYSILEHRLLFDFMMAYIEADRANIQSQQALKLIPILIGIQGRLKNDNVPLQVALHSVFNLKTSAILCQTDDPDEIVRFLEVGFKELMPSLQVKHLSLSSEVRFNRLQIAAVKYKPLKETPLEWLRVRERFRTFDETQEEMSMTWLQWVYYYFNHEALRDLFNCSDDAQNVATINAAFEAFLQQEAERPKAM